jgi:peptidoglycan hydrolase-like protein with peptidoglycan-binding domain
MRPTKLVMLVVTTAAVSAGIAWVAASPFSTPGSLAAQARPPSPSLVTVPLRRGQLGAVVNFRVDASDKGELSVTAPSDLNGDLPVVTNVSVSKGSPVSAGEVLFAIAGRPVIVLPGRIPEFRDLTPGESGVDVAQLQSALISLGFSIGSDAIGSYGSGTAAAVADLYARAGFAPVFTRIERSVKRRGSAGPKGHVKTLREATIPRGEVVFVPSLPQRIVGVSIRVGGLASTTRAAVAIGSGKIGIAGRVDSNGQALLRAGDRGIARSDVSARTVPVRVQSVASAPTTSISDNGQSAGPTYTVSLVPTGPVAAGLVGQNLDAQIRTGRSSAGAWIVPAAGVTTTATGSTFITVSVRGREREIKVTAGLVSGGREAVRAAPGTLFAGEPVVIGIGTS